MVCLEHDAILDFITTGNYLIVRVSITCRNNL